MSRTRRNPGACDRRPLLPGARAPGTADLGATRPWNDVFTPRGRSDPGLVESPPGLSDVGGRQTVVIPEGADVDRFALPLVEQAGLAVGVLHPGVERGACWFTTGAIDPGTYRLTVRCPGWPTVERELRLEPGRHPAIEAEQTLGEGPQPNLASPSHPTAPAAVDARASTPQTAPGSTSRGAAAAGRHGEPARPAAREAQPRGDVGISDPEALSVP